MERGYHLIFELYLTQAVAYADAKAGAAVAVQSFSDFQNFDCIRFIKATSYLLSNARKVHYGK